MLTPNNYEMHYAAKGEQRIADWTNNQRFDVVIQCSISPQEERYIQTFLEYTLQETFTEVYLCGIMRLLKPGGSFCLTGSAAEHQTININFAEINGAHKQTTLQGNVLQVWSRQELMKYTSQRFKVAMWSDDQYQYTLNDLTINCEMYFNEENVNSVKTPSELIDLSVIDFYVQCINVWCRRQGRTPIPRVRLAKTNLFKWMSWIGEDAALDPSFQLFFRQMDALEKDTIFLSPVHRSTTVDGKQKTGHWNRLPFHLNGHLPSFLIGILNMVHDRRLWIWDSLGRTSYYTDLGFDVFQATLVQTGWKVEFKDCKQQVESECAVATLQNAEALMVGATMGFVDWYQMDVEKLQNVFSNVGARRVLAEFLEHMSPRCENWFDVVMTMNPSGCFWNLTILKKKCPVTLCSQKYPKLGNNKAPIVCGTNGL